MRAWLVVVLVVAILVLPTTLASHNMGHRYLVHGRLLDGAGMPLQNQRVEIRLMKEGTLVSSIASTTDCLGDFDSWKGEVVYRGVGDGGGAIEGPLSIPGGGGSYVNFHFHDPDLSSLFSFELVAMNETWTEGFDSRHRQTVVRHELQGTATPRCGNYDQFNSTFEVRVFVAATDEMTYKVEPTPKARAVDVRYEHQGQAANSSGRTDFMYTYVSKLNASTAVGARITIEGDDLGTRTRTVTDEDARFHRVDSINVLSGGGASFTWLKWLGGIVLVGAIIGAFYYGGQKMKAKREEARLMQGSTRRRFRKERGGPGV